MNLFQGLAHLGLAVLGVTGGQHLIQSDTLSTELLCHCKSIKDCCTGTRVGGGCGVSQLIGVVFFVAFKQNKKLRGSSPHLKYSQKSVLVTDGELSDPSREEGGV